MEIDFFEGTTKRDKKKRKEKGQGRKMFAYAAEVSWTRQFG